MDARKYLLLACSTSQKFSEKTVWEQSSLKKKQKKMFLLYIIKKVKEKSVARRTIWTRQIFSEKQRHTFGCGTSLFLELAEDKSKFFNYFRMTKKLFFELLDLINGKIEKQHVVRTPISSKIRLAITLRYLASGDSMVSLSYAFRIAPQTVSRIILETCYAIWDCLAKDFLKAPTEEEWKKKAGEFERQWNFPHCIGALDGKHIIIQVSKNFNSISLRYLPINFCIVLGSPKQWVIIL